MFSTCKRCSLCKNVVKKSKLLWYIRNDVLHMIRICKSCCLRRRRELRPLSKPLFATIVLEFVNRSETYGLDAFSINDLSKARHFTRYVAAMSDLKRTGLFLSHNAELGVDRRYVRWFQKPWMLYTSMRDAYQFVCTSYVPE